ncbi:IclR family transcriptional regulator [Sphingobium algorifonticola]|uniref:IclR family transcriptional regulator n=1 Tax=Sphingobium algorifonticola TaxID=2008318 RepID=A0A437JCW6_9SPHN|nr:IclR family transcriptional regulator [Sphingobium algorifonticola]RVT43462.1 IclR family transcriptional regulator [Sphingobium algorifonticola]
MSKVDEFQVPALDRALTILELLASHSDGMRMREIADHLELPPNSVFRITGALEARGYLNRDGDMRYRLTRKLLSLGYAAIGEDKLIEHAIDVMQGLRDATGETVLIGVRVDMQGVVLEQVAASNPIKFLVDPGTHFPLHASAPGKVFIAYMRAAERNALLDRMTFTRFNERTIDSRERFDQEIEKVLADGFAIDCGEEIEGLRCVGAPIFNHRGAPTAAIWVTGPSFRFDDAQLRVIGRQVAAAAATISRRFGFELLPDKKKDRRQDVQGNAAAH